MADGHVAVSLTVNGQPRQVDVDPRLTLVDVIRDGLGLKGTHVGCRAGDCGACTVMVDGEIVKSCLVLAVSADGAIVDTVEGMATDDELSPVQQAFWDEYGFQCGYCLPGMLFSAQDLLSRNPRPGDEDIRDAISGNLCRCTGYHGIVRAVRQAATNLAGDGRVGGGEDVERVAEKTPGLGTGQATKQDDAGRPPTG